MNPYDKEKTRQIWKRVLGEEEHISCRAFDSEQLLEMIAEEKTRACFCMVLARRTAKGTDDLRRLAREISGDAKRLEAVYYLWTGAGAGAKAGCIPKCACPAEGIRLLYCGTADAMARYRRTAEEIPEFRACFHALAEAKTRQGEQLCCLLQRYV